MLKQVQRHARQARLCAPHPPHHHGVSRATRPSDASSVPAIPAAGWPRQRASRVLAPNTHVTLHQPVGTRWAEDARVPCLLEGRRLRAVWARQRGHVHDHLAKQIDGAMQANQQPHVAPALKASTQ
jgi:hypothetical protein